MVEFEANGKLYKVHKPTLGTQKRILVQHGDKPQAYQTLVALENSIKVETAPGSGTFRSMTTAEFDAMNDDDFQPFRKAFRDLGGQRNSRRVNLEDLLELQTDLPLEMRAWVDAKIAELEAEDPFA